MDLLSISIVFIAGGLTYVGIGVFRALSHRKQWLDVPNQRSSHMDPTPRGAGLVVVPVCLAGYLLAANFTGSHVSWAYFAGAFFVAGVSWLDDLYSIAFGWRLLVHFVAALLVANFAGHWTVVSFGDNASISFGWFGSVVTVLWIVWVINAYNFMDGIDGIAGVQGLAASAAWAMIAFSQEDGIYLFSLVIFASLAAFVLHNWSPAQVFIGDVGSAFLGYTFAVIPILLASSKPAKVGFYPLAAVLILWPFIFDTVLTMLRRLTRGEMVWRAHREHLYQRLVIGGLSHGTVAAIYGIFAVFCSCTALIILLRRPIASMVVVFGVLAALSILLIFVVSRTERRAKISDSPHGI